MLEMVATMTPEHDRLQACLQDLAKPNPPHRPPFRPWRRLEIGQAALMPCMSAAKAGVDWAKRHGRLFTRKKQKDGSGWLVRREA